MSAFRRTERCGRPRDLESGSRDTTVRIWDLESGRCLRVLEGHPVGVVSAAWTGDERRILSCDWNGGVRVWG